MGHLTVQEILLNGSMNPCANENSDVRISGTWTMTWATGSCSPEQGFELILLPTHPENECEGRQQKLSKAEPHLATLKSYAGPGDKDLTLSYRISQCLRPTLGKVIPR